MAKQRTVFICQQCGAESAKWIGRCPSCNEWNTYVEEVVAKESKSARLTLPSSGNQPKSFASVITGNVKRISTHIGELDRVLGGGLVPGSMILLGGEPGIGKSTLGLQMAMKIMAGTVLYVSGEESEEQIKMRAERINISNDKCFLLSEVHLESIILHCNNLKPAVVIIDSVQTLFKDTMESAPGSVSQIRECTSALQRLAKESRSVFFLIGHINKEGHIAGPKLLEHIVDTVLQFEGDMNNMYRLLRVMKNRFGATSELAIFEMHDYGLKEIINPSEILLSHSDEELSGIAIAATIDGFRPFLIEIQALVSSAVYGTPQRSATGYDYRRLNMLLAVLEKRAGFRLATKDVFLNIAGGLKVNDPAIDLAVVAAVLSSSTEMAINKKYCFCAEVGLSGEIRPVNRIVQRIKEAEKLGFSEVFISRYDKKNLGKTNFSIRINYLARIEDLYKYLFRQGRRPENLTEQSY